MHSTALFILTVNFRFARDLQASLAQWRLSAFPASGLQTVVWFSGPSWANLPMTTWPISCRNELPSSVEAHGTYVGPQLVKLQNYPRVLKIKRRFVCVRVPEFSVDWFDFNSSIFSNGRLYTRRRFYLTHVTYIWAFVIISHHNYMTLVIKIDNLRSWVIVYVFGRLLKRLFLKYNSVFILLPFVSLWMWPNFV